MQYILTTLMRALRMDREPPRRSEAAAVRVEMARLRFPSSKDHTDSNTLITVPRFSRTTSLTNDKLTTPVSIIIN